ncbi:RNA 3'-terminal phosphate cyclase (ATP) [Methanofollis sp. W23]|uniref:RNA 3'-terminal phosphate cyclase n=1 Tax=Methanofollis sp. W23 TaxID=2817849 RepID=UPI001AE89E79|nr:RNA 3'-terminal phosphate cyclase [Methanofollis sp. W23]MBP2146357.1 RNA 3'-terminal phosphate cyclase (ATP) [Methanofollis sp. W23]
MLEIDGSMGEGGGQVARTAVALAALTGTRLRLTQIRAGRPKPGLAAQHCTAVRAVALACGAEMEGCAVGSTELTFVPGDLRRTEGEIAIGTAGSIPLVLQAWLPVALATGGSITLTGGTEVQKSPTIDYCARVLLPVLQAHGAKVRTEVLNRGYFPRGGGRVRVTVEPSTLHPLDLDAVPPHRGIVSCSQALPEHVAERQATAAVALLHDYPVEIVRTAGPGTGTSVTTWCGTKGGVALGRRGLPAEKVGRTAARELLAALEAPGQVDIHLADQLLVYLALSGGRYTAPSLSSHAATTCALLARFGHEVTVSGTSPVVFSA